MQQDDQVPSNHETRKEGGLPACEGNIPPTVICFHGSGVDALSGWKEFISLAQSDYEVVLLDRGSTKVSLEDANSALLEHLRERCMDPPYILVAHSYGGAFAKMFLHQEPRAVAGMLLVETGQEGGLPGNVEQSLLSRSPLGNKPLSVIRGNSLIISWKNLQAAEVVADSESAKAALKARRQILESCDIEDDRLKRAQLRLSENARYVRLPDCGHGVIRDRPGVVLEELQWVMANLQPEKMSTNLWDRFRRWWLESRT